MMTGEFPRCNLRTADDKINTDQYLIGNDNNFIVFTNDSYDGVEDILDFFSKTGECYFVHRVNDKMYLRVPNISGSDDENLFQKINDCEVVITPIQ